MDEIGPDDWVPWDWDEYGPEVKSIYRPAADILSRRLQLDLHSLREAALAVSLLIDAYVRLGPARRLPNLRRIEDDPDIEAFLKAIRSIRRIGQLDALKLRSVFRSDDLDMLQILANRMYRGVHRPRRPDPRSTWHPIAVLIARELGRWLPDDGERPSRTSPTSRLVCAVVDLLELAGETGRTPAAVCEVLGENI